MTLLQSYLEFIKELELLKISPALPGLPQERRKALPSIPGVWLYLPESSRKNFRNWMGKSF